MPLPTLSLPPFMRAIYLHACPDAFTPAADARAAARCAVRVQPRARVYAQHAAQVRGGAECAIEAAAALQQSAAGAFFF